MRNITKATRTKAKVGLFPTNGIEPSFPFIFDNAIGVKTKDAPAISTSFEVTKLENLDTDTLGTVTMKKLQN